LENDSKDIIKPTMSSEELAQNLESENAPAIELDIQLTRLIDDRVLKTMQVRAQFLQGAWLLTSSNRLRFARLDELGNLAGGLQALAKAAKDADPDKEAIVALPAPTTVERQSGGMVLACGYKISKPNAKLAFEPIESAG